MATLYFGWPAGQYGGYWGDLTNWFTDSACTIPAAALPTINDHVVIQPQPTGSSALCYISSNATAASVSLIDNTGVPGQSALYLVVQYDYENNVPNTLTVSGDITNSNVNIVNYGAIVCGGTITVSRYGTNGRLRVEFIQGSITCSQLILNDAQLILQGYGSIVGNVQCNNTQISLTGSGHVQSRTTSTGEPCYAHLGMIPTQYGVLSITGNLTLNNGYSVIFYFPPEDYNNNFSHAGCLVTGDVTMTKTSLFAGTANGTGYMDIDSLIAAHKYQGSQPIYVLYNNMFTIYTLYFDYGVYGGGVVAVYDKGINGSSILGIV